MILFHTNKMSYFLDLGKTCPELTDPDGGTYGSCTATISTSVDSDTCTLTCDTGYTGGGDITCNVGTWGTAPTCTGKSQFMCNHDNSA